MRVLRGLPVISPLATAYVRYSLLGERWQYICAATASRSFLVGYGQEVSSLVATAFGFGV